MLVKSTNLDQLALELAFSIARSHPSATLEALENAISNVFSSAFVDFKYFRFSLILGDIAFYDRFLWEKLKSTALLLICFVLSNELQGSRMNILQLQSFTPLS